MTKRRRAWSLLRNRLCALTSATGGFGFTCGVEWLATEKIRVHDCIGLSWGNRDNIVSELARLNELLADHPYFFDGAKLRRLSLPDSPIYALLRESAEGNDSVLVLINTDVQWENSLTLSNFNLQFERLAQPLPKIAVAGDKTTLAPPAEACYCLAPSQLPQGLSGDACRRRRAQAAWAIETMSKVVPVEVVDNADRRPLAEQVERSPKNSLAAVADFAVRRTKLPLAQLLSVCEAQRIFSRVIVWTLLDHCRVTPYLPGHWLLIEDHAPFRATLERHRSEGGTQNGNTAMIHVQSIPAGAVHIACFAPQETAADGQLILKRFAATSQNVSAAGMEVVESAWHLKSLPSGDARAE